MPKISSAVKIIVQAHVMCREIDVRRKNMQMAMSYALALMYWEGFRYLQNFSSRDLAWLVIGVLLAMGVMFLLSRQRRRWF